MTETATPCEILQKAMELIKEPDHWTQKKYARDKFGGPAPYWEERAVAFCSIGAINRVEYDLFNGKNMSSPIGEAEQYLLRYLESTAPLVGGWVVAVWNDAPERKHEEVLAAFSGAITLCKGECDGV